jgi:methyl-accepting chemotaxis protein
LSLTANKERARESLNTLYEIAEKIESELAESDDYWTWATFYKDKKDELMPIKDEGKQAVEQLQDSVEALREMDSSGEYSEIFERIDRRKEKVGEVVDSLREMGSIKNAIMNGGELADLLQDLLERFRETSDAVESLLDAMEE